MRDITHPYLGLGSIPMRPDDAKTLPGRESPEMERIRGEILRLGTVSGPEPDWRAVVDCAVVLLRDQRKDLQVGCYLCWGLFEREGYTGLAVGLTVIKDMIALYWDTLHPPADRMKARLACLDWLAENLATRLERTQPSPGDGAALERSLSVFVDLEETLRPLFGGQAPPFGHARRQVAEYLGRLPGPKPQPPAALPAVRPSSPVEAEAVPAVPAPAPTPAAPPPPPQPQTVAPAKTVPAVPAPTVPRHTKRILTPAERAHRRTRVIAASVITALLTATAAAGSYYWYFEVKRVNDIASGLISMEAAPRGEALRTLAELRERQRAALLRDHKEPILDHYIGLATAAAERFEFIEADAYLETVFSFYPDSIRLAAARTALQKRNAEVKRDVAARRLALKETVSRRFATVLSGDDRAAALSSLERVVQLIALGDLRNAREQLNRLAARLPAGDEMLARDIPDLAAFAVVELAETEVAQERFTRALQLIIDGVVFLPDHPVLRATRLRLMTNRSEYLLRRTVEDPNSLESLLVKQAADQMRTEAPRRFQAVSREVQPLLAARLDAMAKTDTTGAQRLSSAVQAVFGTGERKG